MKFDYEKIVDEKSQKRQLKKRIKKLQRAKKSELNKCVKKGLIEKKKLKKSRWNRKEIEKLF